MHLRNESTPPHGLLLWAFVSFLVVPLFLFADGPGEVLTAEEQQSFFTNYFARMTAAENLNRFQTPQTWLAHRAELKGKIQKALGLWPWPERVELNPRITGRIEYEDYVVERVYYQVYPNIYASGYNYLPKAAVGQLPAEGRIRYPGILNPHGHWAGGAVHPTVQMRLIGLAKKGYVAFCPDSTHVTNFPLGLSPIGQMTWNNIRALDYLQSLACVDGGRLGCTGASGGGQQTMYLAALDERVKVAVPAVLVSYFRRILFATEEAHCFCNHVPGIEAFTDEPEMAAMAAPRPALFICATGDWTREFPKAEFPEIQHIFNLVGGPAKCVQFDKPHNYDRDSREQMYAWMNQYLQGTNTPDLAREADFKPEPPERLLALGKLPENYRGMEGASNYYQTQFLFKTPQLTDRPAWIDYLKDWRLTLASLLGENAENHPQNAQFRGKFDGAGISGEKWLLETEPSVSVPLWMFSSGVGQPTAAVILTHQEGKQGLLRDRAPLIKTLVENRIIVIAVDTRMRGELRRNWHLNELIWGRPEDGMAAHDLISVARWLRTRPEVHPSQIMVVGFGDAGLSALYAGALDVRLAGAAIEDIGPLFQEGRTGNLVANILRHGDIPQVAALVAPRALWINGKNQAYQFTAGAYSAFHQAGRYLATQKAPSEFAAALVGWVKENSRE